MRAKRALLAWISEGMVLMKRGKRVSSDREGDDAPYEIYIRTYSQANMCNQLSDFKAILHFASQDGCHCYGESKQCTPSMDCTYT